MKKATRHFLNFEALEVEQKEAARILAAGGLVVMPTETVYGLAANALSSDAVGAIFKAKGRPADNPLIVHLASLDQLGGVVSYVPQTAVELFRLYAPGPLTLVLPKSERIPDLVSAGLPTVGIRIPAHPVAHRLLRLAGVPAAAPSANRSGRVSPTSYAMALTEMDGRADAIIDGGPCQVGLESTVALAKDGEVQILRPGAVTYEMIADSLPGVRVTAANDEHFHSTRPVLSPGMKYAHYQPDALVSIWQGAALPGDWNPSETGMIGLSEDLVGAEAAFVMAFETVEEYSARFYSALAEADAHGVKQIAARPVPEKGLGHALMNRLKRAAAGRIIS